MPNTNRRDHDAELFQTLLTGLSTKYKILEKTERGEDLNFGKVIHIQRRLIPYETANGWVYLDIAEIRIVGDKVVIKAYPGITPEDIGALSRALTV